MLIPCLFIISLVLTAAISYAGGLALWAAVLLFAGCFLLVNIVYILCAFMSGVNVDMSRPIEKEKRSCRFAATTVFGLLIGYLGLRVHVSGMEKLPKDRRFLLVGNHRSGFDPVVMMHLLHEYSVSFIAKPSVMALPFIGKVAYGAGCLGIDRENDRNALKTIITAAKYLKDDICSICIFPEGTRSKTGEMLPFHAGSFKIAQRASAPLVIASIRGTEQVTKNVLRRRTDVEISFLELMEPEQVKAMSTQELADYSRGLIAESLAGGAV